MGWIIGFLKKFFPNLFGRLGKFLVGFIGPIITPVLAFIAQFFKKVAIFFMIVAAIHFAVNVLVEAIVGLLGEVLGHGVVQYFEVGRMFLPSNLSYCVSLLVIAKIKSLVFYWIHRLSEQFIHT
ncbi:hypothetical protein [Pseudomonas tumuqii]|uniref:hypothetical protein n=1 Tax=Pseudomonas tumuqii TaxID=2715755 RepID=UPI001557ED4A|nr:hypothetical protein [Pseudomonas tumuqii]